MLRIISIAILVLFIVLLPPAALAFVSQDAIPGDSLYPVKRKLEEGIILIVSFNPISKAWFSASLAQKRFEESTGLLAKKDDVRASGSLQELVSQTSTTVADIKKVQDKNTKRQMVLSLVKSIDQYNQSLTQTKNQLSQTSRLNQKDNPPPVEIEPEPVSSPTFTPSDSPTPGPSSSKVKPSPSAKANSSPSLVPTATPRPTARPTNRPTQAPPPAIVDQIDQTTEELQREKDIVNSLLVTDGSSNQTDDSTPIDDADEDIDSNGWLGLFNNIFGN